MSATLGGGNYPSGLGGYDAPKTGGYDAPKTGGAGFGNSFGDGTTGAAGSGNLPMVVKVAEDVSPEVRALIDTIQNYKSAIDWDRIDEATSLLDDDAVYDSPFMFIPGGRERIRAVAKLLAPFAYAEFKPKVARIVMNSAERKAELEFDGTLDIIPRRYWWAPVTWFLPSHIPVEGTVGIHVKSWNDKIARVYERYFNIPTLMPLPVRWMNGWFWGVVAQLSEPALRTVLDSFQTGYIRVEDTGRHVATGAVHGLEKVGASGPVQAVASKLPEGIKNTVAGGMQRVSGMVTSE